MQKGLEDIVIRDVILVSEDKNLLELVNSTIRERKFENISVTMCNLREIFPMISNVNQSMDLIILDINECEKIKDENCVDIISTLLNLLSYTVIRKNQGKPSKRLTQIVVRVNHNTSVKKIREIMQLNILGLIGKVPASTQEYSFTEMIPIYQALRNVKHIPFDIKSRLVTIKKTKTNSDDVISLTNRQQEILDLIRVRGCSNKSISKILNISESTVKLHVSAILKKYNVNSRTQLAIFSDS